MGSKDTLGKKLPNSGTLTVTDYKSRKEELFEAVMRKKREVEALTEKIDSLSEELLTVRAEYMARIGNLYSEIDRLDRDIFILQEVLALIRLGVPKEEAKNRITAKFRKMYGGQAGENYRTGTSAGGYTYVPPERKEMSQSTDKEMKALYKKLIRKFHPDLTSDPHEKKRRETLMKKINKAYESGSIGELEMVLENEIFPDIEETDTESLKKRLTAYIDKIQTLKKAWSGLLKSEWNIWKKRMKAAEKSKKNIFSEFSELLTEEIRQKSAVLKDLKASYEKE